MIKFEHNEDTFEIHFFFFRIGWTYLVHPDYALVFHIGFLNPGISLMLTWRRNG